MENQRIRLSKKMLKDALIVLLRDKNIKDISIQEICQKAQINRTTFYKYFGSQYDLLEDIEREIFLELESCLKDSEPFLPNMGSDGLTRILSYFDRECDKCRMLINATTDMQFAEKLFSLPIIHQLMSRYTEQEYARSEIHYVHAFVMNGGYALIRNWINQDARESPQEISDLIQRLMTRLLVKG